MKRSLDSVDIAKFIGSIMIFCMHGKMLGDYPGAAFALEMLDHWAVPLFFISSSYFLFRKSVNGNIEKKSLQKYIGRIGSLYLVWLLYNLPSVFYLRLYGRDLSSLNTWLVFIKNSLLSSTFTGSWYLLSCIFSAWLVYILSEKFRTKAVILMTAFLYILCVFTSAYGRILPSGVAEVTRFLAFPLNIFNGCLYFALGKFVSENEASLLGTFTKYKALTLTVVFSVLFSLEMIVTKKTGIYWQSAVAFSTVFIAFFLLLFCLQASVHIKCGRTLRKLSIIIYCCQGNVFLINTFLSGSLGWPAMNSFFVCVPAACCVCLAVLYIQKKKEWKWTQYLT